MVDEKRVMRSVGLILVGANLLLALVKTGGWLLTDSLALQSEAANSWVDTLYSLVVLSGIVISTKDPNESYPEGYRRVEPFVSLIISLGIFSTSVFVGMKAIRSLSSPEAHISLPTVGLGILFVGAIAKYAMYKYCLAKSETADSPAVAAVATENRNDILTAMIAVVGIVGSEVGFPQVDAVAAIIIALAIAYSGYELLHENLGYILARAPDSKLRRKIKEAALSHKDVYGVHDTEMHYSGPLLDVSMHIEVEGGMTVEKAHDIEISVADRIRDTCDEPINEINIHVDPLSLGEWKSGEE